MSAASFFELEYQVTLFLTTLAKGSFTLIILTRFFAIYAIFMLVGFALLSFFINWSFIRISGKLLFLELLLTGVTAWVINQFISLFFYRLRPFIAHRDTITSLIRETFLAKSFPSDHAAVAMALATVLFLWSPKVGSSFIALAAAIAIARVFAGVHYPTDAIAGLIVGAAVGYLVHHYFS